MLTPILWFWVIAPPFSGDVSSSTCHCAFTVFTPRAPTSINYECKYKYIVYTCIKHCAICSLLQCLQQTGTSGYIYIWLSKYIVHVWIMSWERNVSKRSIFWIEYRFRTCAIATENFITFQTISTILTPLHRYMYVEFGHPMCFPNHTAPWPSPMFLPPTQFFYDVISTYL